MKVNRSIRLYVFLLLALYMSFSYTWSSLSPSDIYLISIDPLISEQEQQKIAVAINEHTSSHVELLKNLEQQFPHIKSIMLMYQPRGIKKLIIATYAPQARVNSDQIINEVGALEPLVHYTGSFADQLVQITVPQTSSASLDRLVRFVQLLPPMIYQRFSVTWARPTDITLYDKEHNNFAITCDDSRILERLSLEKCETIYSSMQESRRSKKNQKVITDVRFDHQIIAYFEEGGLHGPNII